MELIKNYDLIFLTETWISKNTYINFDIEGYYCEHLYGNKSRNAKKGRYSGGITIYYKQTLKDKINIIEKDQNGIIWVKICKSLFDFDSDLYMCCTYIPPKIQKF